MLPQSNCNKTSFQSISGMMKNKRKLKKIFAYSFQLRKKFKAFFTDFQTSKTPFSSLFASLCVSLRSMSIIIQKLNTTKQQSRNMQKADKLIVRFRLGKIKITTRKSIFYFNKKNIWTILKCYCKKTFDTLIVLF